MNYKDILAMGEAYKKVAEAGCKTPKNEAMDPVDAKELKGKHKDRKDKDINNDGDVDKSDEYLHKRRKAVSKAIKGKGTETEVQTQESVEELDELSKKTLGNYIKKADKQANKAADSYSNAAAKRSDFAPDTPAMAKNAKKFAKRDTGADLARKRLAMKNEAKDHGNMNNGSPAGEGLSPSAKKELANKTPMNPATDELATNALNFKTFKAMTKKAPMRSNDNAAGDKTPPKAGK